MALPGLSRGEERALALQAQALSGARPEGGPMGVVRRLGAVQLDTISVLARSHLLVCWARIGRYERAAAEAELWSEDPNTFEYWAHAACILPIEHWPLYGFRRRQRQSRGRRWHRLDDAEQSCREVLARLAEGPCTASELGGAKAGGPWWDWTQPKIAVEWLLDTGKVVCTRRVGWRRVYDLAERAIAPDLRALELDDATCVRSLVTLAGRGLGVATRGELGTYFALSRREVAAALPDTGLVPVAVEASTQVHYADPAALAGLAAPSRSRTTLLSPFDSLLWDRPRAERLFGLVHRLEAYVPRPARVHGYYAMPVLSGGRIVARVDPARSGRTLVARRVTIERRSAVEPVARALREAARWIDADDIAVEEVRSAELRTPLVDAVARGA